jgi:hypothetical protein
MRLVTTALIVLLVITGGARGTDFDAVKLNAGEELLELANTCNFLVSEWARALADLHDLRRMSSS